MNSIGYGNFNSHAHVERDLPLPILRRIVGISTHTLTWSVTSSSRRSHGRKTFQLTRSRGAWPCNWKCFLLPGHFNSHAHVERDWSWKIWKWTRRKFQLTRSRGAWRNHITMWNLIVKISTHTLTWSVTDIWVMIVGNNQFQLTRSRGAWRTGVDTRKTTQTFQLTRSRGAWLSDRYYRNYFWQFQLTRSRGAWRVNPCIVISTFYFNSHAHVERDFCTFLPILTSFCISTHTLTWSVTQTKTENLDLKKFQLTRSRGAWLIHKSMVCFQGHFNSHAHVERDIQRVQELL